MSQKPLTEKRSPRYEKYAESLVKAQSQMPTIEEIRKLPSCKEVRTNGTKFELKVSDPSDIRKLLGMRRKSMEMVRDASLERQASEPRTRVRYKDGFRDVPDHLEYEMTRRADARPVERRRYTKTYRYGKWWKRVGNDWLEDDE